MKYFSDEKIVNSWKKNADPWINAIQQGEIESRVSTTNRVILNTIYINNPDKALDIGCGEGWLTRELVKLGVDTLGVDVVAELIKNAKIEGIGRFKVLSYEDVSPDTIKEKFDVIVSNFSLLGKESVNKLFHTVPLLLHEGGVFIIQTIHPLIGLKSNAYKNGWRKGSWAGFSEKFQDPAPWYFRTLSEWNSLFYKNGFEVSDIIEPINPTTKKPASIIFVGKIIAKQQTLKISNR